MGEDHLRDLGINRTSIIRIIKSRRLRWAGHAARIEEKLNAYRILVKSEKERDH
jgi:hypothetical protein